MENIVNVSNNNIKVLVVDDEYTNIEEIIYGLAEFNINKENIFPDISKDKELQVFSEAIKKLASDKKIEKLYSLLKSIIKRREIDILFLDLHLAPDDEPSLSTGESIIDMFVESKEKYCSMLPIVVVSVFGKAELKKGNPKLAPMMHIKKPNTSFDAQSLKESIEDENLNEYWITIIKNYREIRDSEEYKEDMLYIKNKLKNIDNEDKLNNIISIVEDINSNTLANNEKLQTIEIISKSIVKVLPQLANKENVQKVINKLKNDDLQNILGSDFPKHKVESIYSKLKEKAMSDGNAFMDDIYTEVKDIIKTHIKEQADITKEDDIIEKTGKLTVYLYGKIISVATGKV